MKPIIDISHHQNPNSINYDRLAEQVSGVIIRAAYGSRSDTAVERHYAEFTSRNVPVGIYHYITEYMPVQEQVNKLKSVLAGKIYPLGLWTDVELEAGATPLRKRTVDEYIRLTESQVAPIYGIYTSRHYWSLIMGGAYYTDKKLWVAAHYYQIPPLPTGWDSWWLWQHSRTGRLAGYNGDLDLNHFYGTEQQYADWVGGELSEPEPEPEPLFQARVYSWATPYVNIRKEPDIHSQDLGDLEPGTIVPVYAIVGEWYKITNGYVMSKYLEPLGSASPIRIPVPPMEIPPISQKDPRWRYHKLGFSNYTIGGYGCLLNCWVMALHSMGIFTDPARLNDALVRVGGFSGANLYWQAMNDVQPDVELIKAIDCYYVPAPLNEIDALLSRRIPVMVHVDYIPSTPAVDQHWVLIKEKIDDDYIINDPIDGKENSFRARYGDPARWIFRIRAYSRQA